MSGLEPAAFARGASAEPPAMRLRDLIYGLHAATPEATGMIARLDPAIADELHAIVAHRRGGAADFVAHVLMELALDHADIVWRTAVEQRPGLRPNAEVAELGHILVKAMRRHLEAEQSIARSGNVQETAFGQTRIGHPYMSE